MAIIAYNYKMKSQVNIEAIKAFLPVNEPFTREVVRDFFASKGEELTEENLKVRVNRLKSKGVIVNVGRSWYKLNNKKIFEPEISASEKESPFLHL